MRILITFLLMSVLALRLGASGQLHVVTPQALQDWSVSGTDKAGLISSSTLILPAGAQISREFPGGAVILHLKTRPVFSESPAEWPILNVGPAALAMIKKSGKGRLILVLGETTTEELPWPVKIEGDPAALDLFLAYDPASGTGLVALHDQKQAFALPRSTKPVEVWLSAGARVPWKLERMEVLLLADEPVSSPATPHRAGKSDQSSAGQLGSAVERLRDGAGFGETSNGRGTVADIARPSGSGRSTLEVFTPPAVRRARIVEAVRAVIERSHNK